MSYFYPHRQDFGNSYLAKLPQELIDEIYKIKRQKFRGSINHNLVAPKPLQLRTPAVGMNFRPFYSLTQYYPSGGFNTRTIIDNCKQTNEDQLIDNKFTNITSRTFSNDYCEIEHPLRRRNELHEKAYQKRLENYGFEPYPPVGTVFQTMTHFGFAPSDLEEGNDVVENITGFTTDEWERKFL